MQPATTPAAANIVADPAALEAIFASLLADPLVCPRRLMDAASLLVNVERTATPGLFLVASASTPTAAYHVQSGLCDCTDAQRRDARRCKHALAVRVCEMLERTEVDADQLAAEATIPYELTPQAFAVLDNPNRVATVAEAYAELFGDDAA